MNNELTWPRLPVEILLKIFQHIDERVDMANLMLSNSVFLGICRPILYQSKVVGVDLKYNPTRSILWGRTVISNTETAGYVVEAQVCNRSARDSGWNGCLLGGAFYRTIVSSLSRLKNLRTFIHAAPSSLLWMLESSGMVFPVLEEFAYEGEILPLKFLERNTSIESFFWILPNGARLSKSAHHSRILPNLTSFCGPIQMLDLVDCSAPLRDVSDTGLGKIEHLDSLLLNHGSRLRWLELRCYGWTEGLLSEVAKQAPSLQHLQIYVGSYASHDDLLHQVARVGIHMYHLRSLILVSQSSFSSTWDAQEQAIRTVIWPACPALAFVALIPTSTWRVVEDMGWRFNGDKGAWVPPPKHHIWWKFEGPKIDVSVSDYYAVWPYHRSIVLGSSRLRDFRF